MPFAIVLAPEAVEDLRRLTANVRATVRSAPEAHLRHELDKAGRSPTADLGHLRLRISGTYGMAGSGLFTYSGLIPANLTTLPHFSVSSAINLRKSAGEPASTVPPSSTSRILI